MSPPDGGFSEDELVEKPAIELFSVLGWETKNCFHETFGPKGALGRDSPSEVVLVSRLRASLVRLNPALPEDPINTAIEELMRDRSAMSVPQANKEIYQLLKNGIKVDVKEDEEERTENIQIIDWNNPRNNDFFLASQFWISGEMHTRRSPTLTTVEPRPGLPVSSTTFRAFIRRFSTPAASLHC